VKYQDIDWEQWIPQEKATILFVIRDGEILLIQKKRGLGAGKINGPGGRIDPGETAMECAIREVQEELCVTPTQVQKRGELSFQFADGYALHVEVFSAKNCEGEAQETDEAIPLWTPLEKIPYEKMWEDDQYWLPLLLKEKPFAARFLFDGDHMKGHEFTEPNWS